MKRTAIILRGPAGVGKTTTATKLREKIGNAVLFNVDYFIHIFGRNPRIKEDKYFAYNICILLIEQFVKHDYNVIVEELLLSRKDIDLFIRLFKKMNYRIKIFTLMAPLKTLIERDKERGYKYVGSKRIKFLHQEFKYNNILKENCIDTTKYSVKQAVNKIYKISME